MHPSPKAIERPFLASDRAEVAAAAAITPVRIDRAGGADAPYADPKNPSPTEAEMVLDLERAALVVIDPHADLLRSSGAAGPVPGGSGTGHKTVRNLARLFQASKHAGITVAVSLTAESFSDSGFMPELQPYIEGDTTLICSPHKRYSPLPRVNDSGLQLRRQRVRQIILAGLIANLRLESHLRDFREQGFEVAVVRDAIAGPSLPEGDGYLSTLISFSRIANALWTTEQAVKTLGRARYLSQPGAKECTP